MEQRASTAPVAREDDDILEIDLSLLFKAVWTRRYLCTAICGGVIALALAYCYLSTPIFLARCRMLVEPGNLKVTQIQDVYESEFGTDSRSRDAFMTTQIQLITSDHILARVFEHFKFAEKESFAAAREPLRVLEKLIEIKQVPNTNLLDIGFRSDNAAFSAEVSNFIARTYMDDSSRRASGFSQRGLEKLEDELLNMENGRMKAISRLNEYKKKHDILSVEASQSLGIARLTELDRASVNAQEALASAQATMEAIEQWRREGKRLDSIPEAISNPTLTQFKSARLQAQASLVRTLQDFGPGHKSVEIQRMVIRDMDKAIAEETENSLISAQARLEQARVRSNIINEERALATKELKQLDQIADEYKMLEDNLTASEKAYQLVLQRVNELKISRSADSGAGGTFQIIVPATPPMKAAYPQKPKVMVISALAAGMFSVLLCIVLELLDRTLKRREDVENISGLPVYGFIPFADGEKGREDFTAYDKPQSQLAEAFRALRTSLSLSEAGRKARILAVTSAVTGDGKSFTSLNLAVTYARAGKRVLLIDADMRRHRLSSLLRTEDFPEEGLSNVLAGTFSMEYLPALLRSPMQGLPLEFLNSGPVPPNPAELLSGEMLQPFMDDLLRQYDIVIVDAPPVLAVSDTRTLAAVPGLHFLAVVRMLSTEKKQLAVMMDALHTVGANIIGTVMNHAELKAGKYGSYGYGYGYGYRYDNYGYGGAAASHSPWWKKLVRKQVKN